ncbi:MAG TPA: hypothetical protein GYA07_04295 [Verrucomicrobia bacterium]|nr:hypothetical protein [Verrucomicrobiota bacterium]HOB32231.1 hypothetical protein [Verrucomicrobiota bacterium]HPU57499.1 hypothetical protein [Verrucomicrobiota bacterium]
MIIIGSRFVHFGKIADIYVRSANRLNSKARNPRAQKPRFASGANRYLLPDGKKRCFASNDEAQNPRC